MKKTHSVKKITIRYFGIMMVVTILCLFLCSAYSVWVYRQQLRYCNEATQTVAVNNLTGTLDALASFNRDVSSNNVDFSLLSYESSQITIPQKVESLYDLKQLINSRVPENGCIFIFNKSNSIFYYRFGSAFHGGGITKPDMDYMRRLYSRLITEADYLLNSWRLYDDENCAVMMNTYHTRDLYICSLLDLESFASSHTAGTDNIQYAFYSWNTILTNRDYAARTGLTLDQLKNPAQPSADHLLRQALVESEYFPEYGIGLASIIPITGIWNYSRIYLGIAFAALAVVFLTYAATYSIVRRLLIYPLDEISSASRRLSGDQETQTQQNTNLEELDAIRLALDHLVEQKVQLTRENENRLQEKKHAMLQYYQLQTRSHFFLNCLKSIYSMTCKGQTEKTKRMILCFSSHLRYIFHDTLSLVPLEAELAEVNDYHQIIQLDRMSPVLLDADVPQNLMHCRVPPLTIQTFMENSYKYNNEENKLLRFKIQADRITMDDKDYLRLRLSDNGKGYSKEVLESLEELGEVFETHHVGIKNLRRRIGILFDGDYQMAFLNGPNGGAITVIYLPMEEEEKT